MYIEQSIDRVWLNHVGPCFHLQVVETYAHIRLAHDSRACIYTFGGLHPPHSAVIKLFVQFLISLLVFFWVWSPCGSVGKSQRLGEVCYLHLQGWSECLKMDTAPFSETLASTNQSTRRPNPKEHHQSCHRCYFFVYFCLDIETYLRNYLSSFNYALQICGYI
jgi:hypothetical protein